MDAISRTLIDRNKGKDKCERSSDIKQQNHNAAAGRRDLGCWMRLRARSVDPRARITNPTHPTPRCSVIPTSTRSPQYWVGRHQPWIDFRTGSPYRTETGGIIGCVVVKSDRPGAVASAADALAGD